MAIKVQTSDLRLILRRGENIVGDLSPSNSYLKVDKLNNLSVVTFDQNNLSIFGCPADIRKRKKPQIRCALSELLRVNLSGRETLLWINNGNLNISSNGVTSKLTKFENTDSSTKMSKPPLHFKISRQMLEEIFKALSINTDVVDRIENRHIMIEIKDGNLIAHVNDRYMVGYYSTPINTNKSASFRLPVKMLGVVLKVLDDNVLIGWKEHFIRFCSSCADVTMRAKFDDYAVSLQIDVQEVIKDLEMEKPLCKIKIEADQIQKITNQIIDKSNVTNSSVTKVKLKGGRMSLSVEMALKSSKSQTVDVTSDNDFNATVSTYLWSEVNSRLSGSVNICLFPNKAYIQDLHRRYLIPLITKK